MHTLFTRPGALLCSGVLALACNVALAADPGAGTPHHTVYQHRQPDGTLLLTDRIPYGGEDNILEQTWSFPVEDPAVAAARRAELRAEHDAITERLHRMIAQRERLAAEQQMERMRLSSFRAWREAEWQHPHAPRPVAAGLQRR